MAGATAFLSRYDISTFLLKSLSSLARRTTSVPSVTFGVYQVRFSLVKPIRTTFFKVYASNQ